MGGLEAQSLYSRLVIRRNAWLAASCRRSRISIIDGAFRDLDWLSASLDVGCALDDVPADPDDTRIDLRITARKQQPAHFGPAQRSARQTRGADRYN
jgi:hypothetical protein